VVKGEMSLVGPRPEVPRYVEMFRQDYEEILAVRPGITDPVSLAYRDEAELLGKAEDPEEEYVRRVLPEKIALTRRYLHRSSLRSDATLVLKTALFGVRRFIAAFHSVPNPKATCPIPGNPPADPP
jgi:lipopolysaccharide/colanic/teichoic acid biosynthesis glycosyltransferase